MALSRITANSIADGTVVAADIADGSITTAKIADANVTSSKLASTLSISDNFLANNVTANTNLIVPAGSAAAPSIFPSGDTNTGIFFPAADTIAFAEGGAEAMRIDSSGNVGVGTTSPQVKLQVAGDVLNSIGASYGTNIYYDVGAATNKYLANGFGGVLTVAESGSGGFRFYTAPSNSSGAGANATITERARIDSSGRLLVGSTSTSISSTQSGEVYSVGSSGFALINSTAGNWACSVLNQGASGTRNLIRFMEGAGGGTQRGSITTDGSTVAYNTTSDYRLKQNVAPMTGALTKILALNPCTYTWKHNGLAGEGFIAHELQAVCPDAVTGEKDAVETYTDEEGVEQTRPVYQGVDTSFLVATLTAAVQELKAINDAQASRIETLEAKVAALESQ